MADLSVQKYLEVILTEIDNGLFPEEYFNDVFAAESGDETALRRLIEARYNGFIDRADVSKIIAGNEDFTRIKNQIELELTMRPTGEFLVKLEKFRIKVEKAIQTTDVFVEERKSTTPKESSSTEKDAVRFGETGKIELEVLEREYIEIEGKLKSRVSEWKSKYGERVIGVREHIEDRLGIIEQERIRSFGSSDVNYIEDVLDTLKILWNKSLRYERRLFAEGVEGKRFKVSLFGEEETQNRQRSRKSGETTKVQTDTKVRELGEVISSLTNSTRGEMITSLRPHQWDILEQIQLDWGMQESRNNGWQEGVAISPTGSGKTHVMGASVELGIVEGWLDFSAKDNKVIILTHRKEITKQNIRRMRQILKPVFEKYYGRDVNVTKVGGGVWNSSGDVVIVSIPTVGKNGNVDRFKNDLQTQGIRRVLMHQDEYHHSGSSSWGKVRRGVREVIQKGYTLGFTATMRETDRAKSNILIELNASTMMKKGVLPPMELIQVQTGTDLQQIPTRMGDFSTRELSQTVRNPERYEHIMKSLEINGVRKGSGMAPALMFTVDRTHAFETAAYYQMYFGRDRKPHELSDGSKQQTLGNRNIAVITEDTSESEARRIIEAYKNKIEAEYARYEYGDAKGKSNFVKTDKVRGIVDGIVGVITGRTSGNVRRLLRDGSRSGNVEAIVNIAVLEEGFDGWWIQNLVGGRPRLKTLSGVQKPQEIGRGMRWGPDEVDKSGRLKRTPRRRVALDAIDLTSTSRPLATYFEVLGIDQTLSGNYGRRIDVAKGEVTGGGYGGVRDLYDIDDGSVKRKKIWEYDLKELQVIEGERTHYLLPEKDVGALAQKLRNVLSREYGMFESKLSGMAFDLGISEELLVGYLNGEVPDDMSLVRRMGVMLYRGRQGLLASHAESNLGWVSIEKLPEYKRELARLVRQKAIELFGGRLPSSGFEYADGTLIKRLQYNPVNSFLRTLEIEYSNANSPRKFWGMLRDFFWV